ncbi:MAG: Hpt domain-containing protein, partial [Pseudomonadota bacterium]
SGALIRLEQGAKTFNVLVENNDPVENEMPSNSVAQVTEISDVATETATVSSDVTTHEAVTDKAVDEELQDIFLTEAEEVLASLAQHLQTLRVNPTESEALIEVRRAYHTLKGSGRTVGLVGMSDVAWSVEKLLNLIMERKAFPTVKQLGFVENVSAEFAGWVAELQKNQVVTLDPTPFQQRATELESEFEHELAVNKPKPQKEEVLIGGTRTLSKAFFNIFLAEAQQHLQTLIEAQKALVINSTDLPTN